MAHSSAATTAEREARRDLVLSMVLARRTRKYIAHRLGIGQSTLQQDIVALRAAGRLPPTTRTPRPRPQAKPKPKPAAARPAAPRVRTPSRVAQPQDLRPPPDWRLRAVCRSGLDPDLWFPETPAGLWEAVALCGACPVSGPCLELAMKAERGAVSKGRFGIYGGLTPIQRATLHRARAESAARGDPS